MVWDHFTNFHSKLTKTSLVSLLTNLWPQVKKRDFFWKNQKNYVIRCSRVYQTLGMSRLDVSRQLFFKKLCWWRWSVDPTKNLRKMSVIVAPPPSDFQRKFWYFEGGNYYTYQGMSINNSFSGFKKRVDPENIWPCWSI